MKSVYLRPRREPTSTLTHCRFPLATTFREAGIKIRRAESEEPTITLPTAKLPRFGGKFGKIWDSNLADLRKFKKGRWQRTCFLLILLGSGVWIKNQDYDA